MKKHLWIPIAAAGAVMVMAQTSATQGLLNFAKTLQGANALKVQYSVLRSGGAPETFDLCMEKPNKVRLDAPGMVVVADGKTVTTYDKASKTWFRDPQDEKAIQELFARDELTLWAPFFDGNALSKVSAKSLGQKVRRGVKLEAIEASFAGGKKTIVYYLGDNLARQAEITFADAPGEKLIVDARSIEMATDLSNAFTFQAPADARELTAEERSANKWYHSLDEALEAARKLNKMVMIDFNAVWCGPCQRMKAEVFPTDKFKSYGKYFVFAEIDIDEQPALAKAYGATSIPNVHFVKPDGSRVHQFVGYANPDQVFAEMDKAVAMGRG